MYKNHAVFFEKPFSFGELNPPPPVVVVEAAIEPPDPPVADQAQPMEVGEDGKITVICVVRFSSEFRKSQLDWSIHYFLLSIVPMFN